MKTRLASIAANSRSCENSRARVARYAAAFSPKPCASLMSTWLAKSPERMA